MASAGHQKHVGATGSSGGARVEGARQPWRTMVLGHVGEGATTRERAKQGRGNGVELTAWSLAVSLGSGRHRRRRGVAGDLGGQRENKAMQTAMQGGRAHMTR